MNTTTAAGLNSLSIASTAAEIRTPQIEEQVKALMINAKDLQEIVSQVEGSLRPVMRPLPEGVGDKLAQPEPLLVPLAMDLRSICARFCDSVNRLRDIHSALEVPTAQ